MWVSKDGSPLTEIAFYFRIKKRTEAAFGRSVNPHLFRHSAATTIAIERPEQVQMASAVLDHKLPLTTERHYNLAQTINAANRYHEELAKLRRRLRRKGPMRAEIYARYSSDLQREASIEDQVRLCREGVVQMGGEVAGVFSDAAISGSHLQNRPGIQSLLDAARGHPCPFDTVIAESLDRLSRDQEDIAGLFKRLAYLDIKIHPLAEGEINELHIGLKGTMNALFLKDLALKIRRGLRGRIEQGRSGGGKGYGYRVIRELDDKGDPVRGGRRIDETEAQIVRRIFTEYAAGKSPKAIAKSLNAEGILGSSKKHWSPSTIHGNWQRGTGILNNELYIGRLVWNRQRFVKDPETGNRVGRVNPESEWIVKEVPDLRIIDDDLWHAAKQRQQRTRHAVRKSDGSVALNNAHRRQYLLSGLLKCGVCGSSYTISSKDRYACSGHRSHGNCNNSLTIKRQVIEMRVLTGLKEKLLAGKGFSNRPEPVSDRQ